MSTTIDQKVVEMKFDNSNFERNVSTTMSTLDKLKQKLNLDGASKGLDNINNAAANNKIGILGETAQAVSSKFSALETMAVGALMTIGSQAVMTGERLIKSLTMDQIMAGFDKYEQKTQAIQTIMAATGKPIEEVNSQLQKLIWFADETSYSFVDMTSNIGKFTSQGIELETAVTAMEGISNWAAISGQTASEASRAMYNLSQAIGVGAVKLQDWKSIENANMATQEFKQTVLDTAVEMGVLIKKGEGLSAKFYKNGKAIEKNEVSIANFSSTLKDGWFSSEVLLKALDKYGGYADGINEVYESLSDAGAAYSKTTSEIIADMKKLKGASDQSILDAGYTRDLIPLVRELANESDSLGAKALEAAQQAITFSQAIDSVKDAVSSQWMQVFEHLFGDFTKAKDLWTDLANDLWDVFASGLEAKNEILSYLDDNGTLEHLRTAVYGVFSSILKIIQVVRDTFTSIFPEKTQYAVDLMVNKWIVLLEKLSISDKVIRALDDDTVMLSDHEKDQVNVLRNLRSALEGVLSIFKLLGTILSSVIKIFSAIAKQIFPQMSTSALDAAGNIGEFLKNFSEESIVKIEKLTDQIVEFIDHINEMPAVIKAKEIIREFFNEVYEGYKVFEEVVARFKVSINEIRLVLTQFFNDSLISSEFLDSMGLKTLQQYILDFTKSEKAVRAIEKIRDALTSFYLSIKNFKIPDFSKSVTSWLETFVTGFGSGGVLGGVNAALNRFKKIFTSKKVNVENSFLVWLYDFSTKMGDKLEVAFHKIVEWIKVVKEFLFESEKITLSSITDAASKILGVVLLIKAINVLDGVSDIFESISNAFEGFAKAKKWEALASMFKGIALMIAALAGAIYVIGNMPIEDSMNAVKVLGIMALVITAMVVVISKINKTVGTASVGIDLIDSVKSIGNMIAVAMVIASLGLAMLAMTKSLEKISEMNPRKLIPAVMGMMGLMFALATATALVGRACKGSSALSTGVILAFVLALQKVLGVIEEYQQFDWEANKKGLEKTLEMMVILAACVRIMSTKIGKDQKAASNTVSLLAFVLGLKLVLKAVEELSRMPYDQMMQGIVGISAIIAVLTASIVAMSLANKGNVLDKGQRQANNLKGAIVAMIAVCAAVYILGSMNREKLIQGGLAVSSLLIVVGLFTKLASSMANVKWATLLVLFGGMTVVLFALAAVITHMIKLNPNDALKASISLVALISSLSVLIGVLALLGHKSSATDILKLEGLLIPLIGIIAVVGLIVGLLGRYGGNLNNALSGALAISALLLTMTGVLAACVLLGKIAKVSERGIADCIETLYILLPLIFVCAALTKMIAKNNFKGAIPNIAAMATLLLTMSGVLAVCVLFGRFAQGSERGLAATIIGLYTLIPLIIVCAALTKMIASNNFKGAIPNIVAMAALLGVMVLVLAACIALSKLSPNAAAIGITEALLLAMSFVVLAAIGLLKLLDFVDGKGAIPKILSIALLLTVMVAVLSACMILGQFSSGAAGTALAIVGLLMVGVVVKMVADIVKGMNGIDGPNAIDQAKAIAILLGSMTAVLLACTVIGALAPAAIVGAGLLIGFMAALTTFFGALGAISEAIELAPKLEKAVEVMGLVGNAIGSFVGGIAAGAIEQIGNILPELGTNLGEFYSNAKPFFEGISALTPGIAQNVKNLASAIVALTVAELINGVSNFLSIKGGFGELGVSLSSFWENAKPFIEGISKLPPGIGDAAEGFAKLIKTITAAELVNSLTNFLTGGLAGLIGGASLTTIGEQLCDFGEVIGRFSTTISDVNSEKIKEVIPAIEALMSMNLPNSGGLLGKIMGENDWSTVGSGLASFGQSLVTFSNKCEQINVEAIEKVQPSIRALSDVSSTFSNSGGFIATFLGDNDWITFGTGMASFGQSLVTFSQKAEQIKVEAITNSVPAVQALSDVAATFGNSGGKISEWLGDNDWNSFKQGLSSFGIALVDYGNNVAGLEVGNIQNSIPAIRSLANVANELPSFGGAISKFLGEASWTTFGENLGEMGKSISEFGQAVSDSSLPTKVNNGVESIKKLSELGAYKVSMLGISQVAVLFNDFSNRFAAACKSFINEGVDYASLPRIADDIKKMAKTLNEISSMDFSGTSGFIKSINQFGKLSLDGISQGIVQNSKSLIESFKSLIDDLVNVCEVESEKFNQSGLLFVDKINNGIIQNQNYITSAFKTLIQQSIVTITTDAQKFLIAGQDIVNRLLNGIKSKESYSYSVWIQVINYMVQSIRSQYYNFNMAGQYLADGFIVGIQSKINSAANAAASLARAASNAARVNLRINSPSKVFTEIGEYVGEGFVNGISSYEPNSAVAGTRLAVAAVKSAQEMIEDGIDVNPTIMPVLDLSNVEEGTAQLSNMLSRNNALTVSAQLSGQNNQNGNIDNTNNPQQTVTTTQNNTFNITGDNPKEIANEVSRILQRQVERRGAAWA